MTEQPKDVQNPEEKSNAMLHALLIGFLAGVVIYSIAKNTFGLLMLIPIYMIYRLMKK